MITILTSLYRQQTGRKYLRICNTIEQAISEGRLQPGEQLPPQRELADSLAVTLGTVTRGYQEARRRGLLVGETGRGTFIRQSESYTLHGRHNSPTSERTIIPFDLNFPIAEGQPDLSSVLLEMAKARNQQQLLRYQKAAGMEEHRLAALPWLRKMGVSVSAGSLYITAAGQHAIHTILLSQGADGAALGVETFTYPGTIHCARMLGRALVSIPMDASGMTPEGLDAACRQHRLAGIYLMPSIQNPTTLVMPLSRRKEIADVAKAHDLFIIEDDVYGPLQANRLPPLQTIAPERTYYFTNLSKAVAPGLRIGYLVVPPGRERFIETAISATIWSGPPLMAEISSRWLKNGEAERVAAIKRRAAIRRLAIVEEILGAGRVQASAGGLHVWLVLPEQWRGEEFAREAQRRGVAVMPSIGFTANRHPEVEAVRICFGAPPSDDQVREGITILARLLNETPADPPMIFFRSNSSF